MKKIRKLCIKSFTPGSTIPKKRKKSRKIQTDQIHLGWLYDVINDKFFSACVCVRVCVCERVLHGPGKAAFLLLQYSTSWAWVRGCVRDCMWSMSIKSTARWNLGSKHHPSSLISKHHQFRNISIRITTFFSTYSSNFQIKNQMQQKSTHRKPNKKTKFQQKKNNQ